MKFILMKIPQRCRRLGSPCQTSVLQTVRFIVAREDFRGARGTDACFLGVLGIQDGSPLLRCTRAGTVAQGVEPSL